MRLPFLLCLALAACSSDPTDGSPPPPQDVQPFDLASDATDVQRVDVGDDRPGPMDAGADTGFDVGFGFEAAAQEIPGPDVVDAGAGCSSDAPVPCPCGLTTGYRSCNPDGTFGTCVCSAGDAGSDVPADARISCGSLPTEPACSTSAQCAMCQPASTGEVWCCRPNGTCGVSPGVFACP